MRPEGITFNGSQLVVTEEIPSAVGKGDARREAPRGSLFVPRTALSRQSQRLALASNQKESRDANQPQRALTKKGQDDFRKMLG